MPRDVNRPTWYANIQAKEANENAYLGYYGVKTSDWVERRLQKKRVGVALLVLTKRGWWRWVLKVLGQQKENSKIQMELLLEMRWEKAYEMMLAEDESRQSCESIRTEAPVLALFPLGPIFRGDAAVGNARFEEGCVGDIWYDVEVDCERKRRGLELVEDIGDYNIMSSGNFGTDRHLKSCPTEPMVCIERLLQVCHVATWTSVSSNLYS
jgi:hypothetical protein